MLDIVKTTQFRGTSKFGDEGSEQTAKIFEATINTSNPEDLTFNSYVIDYSLYKANRTTISAEQTEFEDSVYAFQDELLASV